MGKPTAKSTNFTAKPTSQTTNVTTKAPPGPPAPPPKLYFVNAWVDYSVIGGLSIAWFLIVWQTIAAGTPTSTTAFAVSGFLLWVCNHPHFSATNYRLYHSRDNIRQYPITALAIPWLIFAGVVGSFISPIIVAPYFVKVFAIWSPYHFSGQSLGITLIYARRAGFRVGFWERLGLSSFIFGTFLTMTSAAEVVGSAAVKSYDVEYYPVGLPTWLPLCFQITMYAGGALFLVLAARWCLEQKRLLPPIVLLPAITQFVWFVPGSYWPEFSWFVPAFHSLQYLLIAWSMQLKEKMDQEHIEPSPHYVVGESLRWGFINIVGGFVLFVASPWIAWSVTGRTFGFATAIILAAVQLHHFFVDGVIWKLKRKTVASPLLVNIDDLLYPTPKAA
jgi:hypothetical protein